MCVDKSENVCVCEWVCTRVCVYVHECVYEWYAWGGGGGYCHSQLGSALVGLGVARVQLHSQGAVFNRLSQLAKLEVEGDIILTYLCNKNP